MSQVRIILSAFALLLLGFALNAGAQQPPDIVKLSIGPAPAPVPALRYRLLPTLEEQTPGNAAPIYYRALLANAAIKLTKEEEDAYSKIEESTVETIQVEAARTILDKYAEVFDLMREATYREKCDWGWRMHDMGDQSLVFRLQEIQDIREIARLIRVKARLHMAEGNFDQALEAFRMNYRLAQAVSEPPVFICRLVGVAITALTDYEKLFWSGIPGTPNLYWAQSFIDHPFINMSDAIWQERNTAANLFPFLRDAESVQRTESEWTDQYVRAFATLSAADNEQNAVLPDTDGVRKLIEKHYPIARDLILARGFDRSRVEKMAPAHVVAIQDVYAYEYAFDELFKLTTVSGLFPRARYKQSEDELRAAGYLGEAERSKFFMPLANRLIPSIGVAFEATGRLEARIASAQIIEALRMHLSTGAKTLPKSLDEIKIVPIPLNPYTGEAFPYRVEGDKAILEIPPMQGWSRIFEITMREEE